MRSFEPYELFEYMAHWVEPLFEDLNSAECVEYRRKKEALMLYASGIPHNQILDATGYNRNQINRMISRCMAKDENNLLVGYYGLLPYYRIKTSIKEQSITSLMNKYPDISKELCGIYFSRKTGPAKVPSKAYVFSVFQNRLREQGYTESDYPLNIPDLGRRSFYTWLDKMEMERNLYMKRKSDNAKVQHRTTGVGDVVRRPRRPYELVEIDGHKLDVIYSIPTRDESGNTVLIPASRPWLLAAIDVYSRCIVGYNLCFRDEYNQYDIIRLIKNIIVPHKTMEGVRNDGFPSAVFKECEYAVPSIIALDNAMAHLSSSVQDLTYNLGISLEYGPVETPDRRPYIERFFGTLESKWGHLLPSTTGSNMNDLKRYNAESEASKYAITRNTIIRTIEMAIAEYNNTHHSMIFTTPMKYLSDSISNNICPSKLSEIKQKSFHIHIKRAAVIRGNSNAGRRPIINLFNHRYVFDMDTSNYSLVGLPVVIEFDPDDIRILAVFDSADKNPQNKDRSKHRLPKGQFIGFAKMAGKDANRPLSIENYNAINKYNNKNKLALIGTDPTTNYIEGLKNNKDKKSLKELENIASTLGDKYIPTTEKMEEGPEINVSETNDTFSNIMMKNIENQKELNEKAESSISSYEDLLSKLW